MACFLIPTIIGIGTTATRKKFQRQWHINWLNIMTFGGALGLAAEHLAHGEITPWPPFLTAMQTPASAAAMLHETVAVGIPMALAIILAWAALVIAYEKLFAAGSKPKAANSQKYKPGLLALMLLGVFIMALVDRAMAFQNGAPFLKAAAGSLISSSFLLGIAMLAPILLIWAAAAFTPIGNRICID